jgi:Icc-related predicted phosphoesterase
MKIVCTSDTHGRPEWKIPPCDVFIHCGDFTSSGSFFETNAFAQKLYDSQVVRHFLLVPGNHDRYFEQQFEAVERLFDSRCHILIDQEITIEGIRFYGSPWTPLFNHWCFMASEKELEQFYNEMPNTLDVLITHGPPLGILDPGFKTKHAGSQALRNAIERRQIRHHVFGHLHGAGGQTVSETLNDAHTVTYFSNVSACNEYYSITHSPFTINL